MFYILYKWISGQFDFFTLQRADKAIFCINFPILAIVVNLLNLNSNTSTKVSPFHRKTLGWTFLLLRRP